MQRYVAGYGCKVTLERLTRRCRNAAANAKLSKGGLWCRHHDSKRGCKGSLFRDCVFYENECFKNESYHFTVL